MAKLSKEAEQELINKILDYERQVFSECTELIQKYGDKEQELGVEIYYWIERKRAVNNSGLVEPYDIQAENKLPRFYSSEIICWIYKDGKRLVKLEVCNMRAMSLFVEHFRLLHATKQQVYFFDNPLQDFDNRMAKLLAKVADYLNTPKNSAEIPSIPFENAIFKMPVDDFFEAEAILDDISGVFVTGHIEAGTAKPGLSVRVVNLSGAVNIESTITGIYAFRDNMLKSELKTKTLSSASNRREVVGLLLSNTDMLNCEDNGLFVIIPGKD